MSYLMTHKRAHKSEFLTDEFNFILINSKHQTEKKSYKLTMAKIWMIFKGSWAHNILIL